MPDIQWSYRPLLVYRAFHSSPQRERLLVGGMGSGKTIALCADAVSAGLQVAGARILMSRKTVPEVRDTLEPEFLNVMPPELYAACQVRRAGGHIESITAPNGTEWLFRAIDDWQKYKSLNIARWYVDELSEFDIGTYRGMRARLRQRFPTAAAKERGYSDEIPEWFRGSAAASNSAGKDWMWKRFVGDEASSERGCWIATTLDNPHLPEDYLHSLFDFPEQWVRRFVLCSFDDFGGLIYPKFDRDRHVTRQRIDLTSTTPIWQALDPGTRHPTAVLYAAVLDRKLVVIREMMAADTLVSTWVARFRETEAKLPPVQWRVADPNSVHVRDRGSEMMSLHAQYLREGFNFQNGPSRHKDRIPMLGQLLEQDRFLMTEACPKLAEQIEGYRWEDLTTAARQRLGEYAETYAPEEPVKVNDDLVDCGQYLSSRWSRPLKPRHTNERKPQTRWQQQSEDLSKSLKQHRARRAGPRPSNAGSIV